VRRLEEGGMVVGLFPQAKYAEETLQLEPGDIIVLFSDGVSEALNAAGDEFGDERIIETVQPHLGLEPTAILDRLMGAVREFSAGTVQRDDITALVIQFVGVPAST
jgi:phosphoserine phosphatase RsbU/P